MCQSLSIESQNTRCITYEKIPRKNKKDLDKILERS